MKEAAKVFAAIVGIVLGAMLIYRNTDMLDPGLMFRSDLHANLAELIVGIVLLGGGLTGVWMMRKRTR